MLVQLERAGDGSRANKFLPDIGSCTQDSETVWICQEDTYQQQEIEEETKGVKTPAKKKSNSKKEETKGVKKPAEKKPNTARKKKTKGLKTPAEKKIQQEIQEETNSKKQIRPILSN